MICPDGNAVGCECHRDWEVLYMRRVPVVVRSEYLEKIFDGIPVLFVDSFLDVTEELLNNNIHLYEQMQTFDLSKLDMKIIPQMFFRFSVPNYNCTHLIKKVNSPQFHELVISIFPYCAVFNVALHHLFFSYFVFQVNAVTVLPICVPPLLLLYHVNIK